MDTIKKILMILPMSIYTTLCIIFPLGGLAALFDLDMTILELLEVSLLLMVIVLFIWGLIHYMDDIIELDE